MAIETQLVSLREPGTADVSFLLPDDVTHQERIEAMDAARAFASILHRIHGIDGPIVELSKPQS